MMLFLAVRRLFFWTVDPPPNPSQRTPQPPPHPGRKKETISRHRFVFFWPENRFELCFFFYWIFLSRPTPLRKSRHTRSPHPRNFMRPMLEHWSALSSSFGLDWFPRARDLLGAVSRCGKKASSEIWALWKKKLRGMGVGTHVKQEHSDWKHTPFETKWDGCMLLYTKCVNTTGTRLTSMLEQGLTHDCRLNYY